MENFLEVLVSCGDGIDLGDGMLPKAVSTVIDLIKIAIPILVVFFGLLDLGKAVVSAKEDEIKKNQGLLIKRLIIAVLVFFVVALVEFLVGLVNPDNELHKSCFNCFINNKCNS